MMRSTTASALALLVLGSATLSAQNRPDFSGRWTPVAPAAGSQVLVIVQDRTSLVAELIEGAVTERVRFTFGGTALQDVAHANVGVTTTASWNGAALDTRTTFKTQAEGTILSVRDEAWSFDVEGRLVIERTTRRGSGEATTRSAVYTRQ